MDQPELHNQKLATATCNCDGFNVDFDPTEKCLFVLTFFVGSPFTTVGSFASICCQFWCLRG